MLQSLREHETRVREIHAGMRAAKRAVLFERPQAQGPTVVEGSTRAEVEVEAEGDSSEEVEEDISAVELVDDEVELAS